MARRGVIADNVLAAGPAVDDETEDMPVRVWWIVDVKGSIATPESLPFCDEIVIGSDSMCDVIIDDPALRPQHLRLEPTSDYVIARDVGTGAATQLLPGGEVFIGDAKISVSRSL